VRRPRIETCEVDVRDIAEFPTELGARCELLHAFGLSCYRNTEEELLEVLTASAGQPNLLRVCLQSSRCRGFYEAFRQGKTPFADKDPIRLVEYGGRFWAQEGKHRVCLAKRAGVARLEAVVWHLEEDTESLLPHEGMPGRFGFSASFCLGSDAPSAALGTVAYLWVQSPPGVLPGVFDFGGAWLDAAQDTGGELVELFPGVQYRVSVARQVEKRGLFGRRERVIVESQVLIHPDHAKTKVWLLEIRAADIPNLRLVEPAQFRTVYRFGCWRQRHLKQLLGMYLSLRR